MLACFNPNLGQIWTNPNVGLKIKLNILKLKVKVEVGLKCENSFFNPTFDFFLTQRVIYQLTLKKNAGLFQIWTNPNVGLKMQLKIFKLKVKVEVGLKCENSFF